MELTTTEIAELRIESDRLAMKGLSSGKLSTLLDAFEDLSAAQDKIQELEGRVEELEGDVSDTQDLEADVKRLRAERSQMRLILEDIQYCMPDGLCPVCSRKSHHKPTCKLATMLDL